MSGNDLELINPAGPYPRHSNARKTPTVAVQDELTPAPSKLLASIRRRKIDSLEPSDEGTRNHGASHDPLNSTRTENYDASSNLTVSPESRRLVIAIDYGTTFTGVAVAIVPVNEKTAKLDDITVVREWNNGTNLEKVPSVISYTKPTAGEEQWGNHLSADAVTMVHTKLELDVQPSKLDELQMILDNLDGMHDLHFDQVRKTNGNPDFTAKKPELVVLDYMKKIFDRVMKHLKQYTEDIRRSLPVDIVITHPVVWSYGAKNATYRAITLAGFNEQSFPKLRDIIMLSEPEAGAVFTARYLKEKSPDKPLLKKNDTFVLCDAGGGTVDVVTFRIVETEPALELEQIGVPDSVKCGSIYIDWKFKNWLRDHVLGPDEYELLEPNSKKRIKPHSTTGKKIRDIMARFIEQKCAFRGDEDEDEIFTIELPEEFGDLTIEDMGWAKDGQLTLDHDFMLWLFEDSINEIAWLVKDQAAQVENYDGVRRVKTILMIGGFGESIYLQSAIEEILLHRQIEVHRPKQSWSAVVRGAALYGIEKARLENYITAERCPFYCGITQDQGESQGLAKIQSLDPVTGRTREKKRLSWVVNRGDLAFSSPLECQETFLAFNFRAHEIRDFIITIYRYLEEDDILPTRVGGNDTELESILSIPINLAGAYLSEFDIYQGVGGEAYYRAVVSLYLTWRDGSAKATVKWKDNVIYSSDDN